MINKKWMKIVMIPILVVPMYGLTTNIGSELQNSLTGKNSFEKDVKAATTEQQAFINKLAPAAQASQEKYKLLSSITLAQGILESNWGKSGLATKGNNLFGIKGKYNGQSVIMQTSEYVNGQWIKVNAEFRKYPSWNESVTDHTLLLVNGTSWNKDLYKKVINATDYKTAATELQKAGYATDPNYASSLIRVIETYDLDKYDVVYDKILSQKTISGKATVTKPTGNAVWTMPYKVKGVTLVGSASNYANKDIDLVSMATTQRGTYYQFKYNGKLTGWIDGRALTIYDKVNYDKVYVGRAKITSPVSNGIWSKPYNVYGREFITNATTYAQQEIKLLREAQTAKGTYYQFSINNKTIGWIDKRALTIYPYDSIVSSKNVNLNGQITNVVGNGIWSKAYKLEGTTSVAPASKYANMDVAISQQIETQHGIYYYISINGRAIGWLDKKAITLYDVEEYNKTVSLDGTIKNVKGNAIWTAPYRTVGTKLVGSAETYLNKDVQIIREAKTPRGTYYQFKSGGKVIGWLDKKAFELYDSVTYNKAVNMEAVIENVEGNAIWTAPYKSVGVKLITSAGTYKNKTVKLTREAQTSRGTYYEFSYNGKVIGWLDKKAFKFYSTLEYDQAYVRDAMITNVSGHTVWSLPYQLYGIKSVGSASNYANKQAKITRRAKTEKGIYYQFSINGKNVGWLDERAFDVYDAIEYNNVINKSALLSNPVGNGIWTEPYRVIGTKNVGQATAYANKTVQLVREAKTTRATYYQMSLNGKIIGWVDARAFTNVK
ncbi:GW domain-containing glycosaminoglycan-binding protein [Listeria immobilis]|uniref:GW domain-containing glycosaminoglycan-binding protein n=1 Tax=Listeria immobilis TaxID=2713502 RepID=A0ABR6SZR8_9LIST|nr:GW domain-containing glycosaminoglycan-binding protein [Listeria immobilis]MBC1484448.1 GW domain-containing glycosaminoglycan-binding protein [Listeria immobilis]MBC1508025.1 GW domain-containing glycosaminoglycan-binding protein [Listeria immobilis]MBC1510975.1 GW domain-containing glycosaminoglycan-binding protein [Listeria immobilis]MBC1517185.1 GW domain-containing glycosaminoglycan-binding protein [Listeria immobilis]MBC6304322.1 GW domain-containing glycosaminoglycan-binding protein 